jgi:hypothetical protein
MQHISTPANVLYGLMAEFDKPSDILEAARRTYEEGYRRIDAYSPFPVPGLSEEIGFHHDRMPLVVLGGGLIGLATGFMLQWYTAVIDYPLNIGGRPLLSLPAFVPITYEMTILIAGLSAAFGMLILNGLPLPYHPVFNVPRFALASKDRFFLCIEAKDPKFDSVKTAQFLQDLHPRGVYEVEP